jgi:predicted nucleic acid-binding protein
LLLLDTNVVSELARQRPAEQVVAWFAGHDPASLLLAHIVQP